MRNQIRRAIDVESNNLIPAEFAIKGKKYKCPQCSETAIFCKGKVIKPYYRHNSESKCSFFENYGETEDHLECKLSIATCINKKRKIEVLQRCINCNFFERYQINFKKNFDYIATCEERISNTIRPDITVRNSKNNQVEFLIEIKNTHGTEEYNREGYKWFELDARKTLDIIDSNRFVLNLKSIRKFRCNNCKEKIICKICNKEEKINNEKYCLNCKLSSLKKIYLFLKPKIIEVKKKILEIKIEKSKKIAKFWENYKTRKREKEIKITKKLILKKEKEFNIFKNINCCRICNILDNMSIQKGYCIFCFKKSMNVFNNLTCLKIFIQNLKVNVLIKKNRIKEEQDKTKLKVLIQKRIELKEKEDNLLQSIERRKKCILEKGKKCKCNIKFKVMCFCENKLISYNAEHCSNCMKFICKCK